MISTVTGRRFHQILFLIHFRRPWYGIFGKSMKSARTFILAFFLAFAWSASAQAYDDDDDRPQVAPMIPVECASVFNGILEQDEYSVFKNAMVETGLDSVLGSVRLRGTILVPSNEAIKQTFAEMEASDHGSQMSPEYLLTDFESLHTIVRHHIIPGYNLYVENFVENGQQCYETMVPGHCLRIDIHPNTSAIEIRGSQEGAYPVAHIVEPVDNNRGCPSLFHGVDRLILPSLYT
jgi:hypothetical protein